MNAPNLDIPTFLDRRKVIWSYSFLNTYDDICPHQAFRKYIKRDIPYVETVATAKGNRGHKAMQNRINGRALPDDFRHCEKYAIPFDGRGAMAEQKLGVTRQGKPTTFFADDAWGRGTLDALLLNGEKAYIGDWKFGSSNYEKPFELQIHAVLLHANNPYLKTIKAQYIYPEEGRTSQIYDVSGTAATWQRICEIMTHVEHNLQTGQFEKRQGPLCKWCDVRDCEFNRKPGGV